MDKVLDIIELDDSDSDSPDQPSTSHDREDPTTSQNAAQALSLPGTSQALDLNLARGLDYLMKESRKHGAVIAKTVIINQKQGDNINTDCYITESSGISYGKGNKNRESEESSSGEGASFAIPEGTNPVKGSIRLTDSLYMLHYETISKLGNVYKGVKIYGKSGQGDIAVKSLKYSEENEREARILVKLSPHQNIANIMDSGIYHLGPVKHIFIAMELCGPDNLTNFIKGSKRTKRIKQILIQQLVNGIAHIHRNNVIHRDLKPDNILISEDGMQLKVIDFGLSKEMKPGHSVTKASALGIGTDGWRAPETYSDNVISKQADVFSLALVIHFIETDGSHPFGDDPVGWSYLIMQNQGCDLSKLGSEIRDLVGWMLRRVPKERPTLDQIQQHKYFGGELACPFPNLCFKQPQTVEELKRQKDEAKKEKQESERSRLQLVMMIRQQSQESQQMKKKYEKAEKEKKELRQKIKVPVEYEKKGEFPHDELQQLKKQYNLTMRVREQMHKNMEKKIKNLMQEKEAVLKEKRDLMQEREAALKAKQHSDKMLQISQRIQHEYETMMKLAGIDIEELRDNMIDPENPGSDSLKFVYSVGDVRHVKRAHYQEKDDSPNPPPFFKNIIQIHGDIMVGASDANNARNTEGSQVGISIKGSAEMEQKSRSLDEQPATSRSARPKHQHKQGNSSSGARSKTTESQSSTQATSSGLINQQPPDGGFSVVGWLESLPGYGSGGTHVITYTFPAGSLNGVSYEAKEFTEYVPHLYDSTTGLLQEAFNAGLLFKIQIIGSNRGEIIWNDEIPHKTNKRGGPDNNGYPDDDHENKLDIALKTKLKAAGMEY